MGFLERKAALNDELSRAKSIREEREILVRAAQDVWNIGAPPVAEERLVDIETRDGPISGVLSSPIAPAIGIVVLFAHGGGWTHGSPADDAYFRGICSSMGVSVLSVDYRLAPEHRFPCASQDLVDSFRWLAREKSRVGLESCSIVVGGASAGANLAVSAVLQLKQTELDCLHAMLLFYGVYDHDVNKESYKLYGDGRYGLSERSLDKAWSRYLNPGTTKQHPLVSVVNADLSVLPPVVLSSAGVDVLRDDTRLFAARLREHGVASKVFENSILPHGFVSRSRFLPGSVEAVRTALTALKNI